MEYYIYRGDNELYHWGIKGMKWGVRRYQNKDGSLTPAGKKRRADEETKLKERERTIKKLEREKAKQDKLDAKKAELDEREKALNSSKSNKTKVAGDNKPVKKTVKELSDDELRAETTRMRLEKEYYEAQKNLASITSKQVSKGQKFANTILNDVIMPYAKDAGKKYLDSAIKNALGIKEEQKINWDDMIKKQSYEKGEKNKVYEDLKRANDIEQERRRKAKMDADAETATSKSSDSKKQDNTATKSDKSNVESSNPAKGAKGGQQEKRSSDKVYEGEVVGNGNSGKKNSEPKQSTKKETIDAEWYEENESNTNQGRSYVTALLEAPKERDD